MPIEVKEEHIYQWKCPKCHRKNKTTLHHIIPRILECSGCGGRIGRYLINEDFEYMIPGAKE